MTIMIIGLLIFLGAHSVHIVAGDWRRAQIAKLGEGPWKGLYSLVSVVGLALAIWGFGMTRTDPVFVWFPPAGMVHLVALLMIPAFILLVATYVPGNTLRARLKHPMLLSVKIWAFAHLLANGRLGDIIFFLAFLAWATLAFRAARQRDRAMPDTGGPAATSLGADVATVVVGLVAYVLFAFYLHAWLIGVPVFR